MAEGQIKAALKGFSDKFAAGDFGGIAGLYTGDCKVMFEKSPLIQKGGVADAFKTMKNDVSSVNFATAEVIDKGDMVVERGSYTLGGVGETGNYVHVWKGGLIHFQITNSN